MKLNELLTETDVNDINEAPAGMIGQMARKAGAKVLNKIGMKGTAGKMATKAAVGDEANRIKQELGQFMAGAGIPKGKLSGKDFVRFLGNAGFPQKAVMQALRKHVKIPDQPATMLASVDNDDTAVTEAGLNFTVTPQIADKVIMDLTRSGFKKQAGGKQVRSKYAMTQPGAAGADVKQAIATLKQAGYKVSK
jgi:hypothetical protein